MRRYKKLVVAAVVAAAVVGGTGAAMAADDSGHGGHGKARQTVSHGVAHRPGGGSKEKGLTRVTKDDGKPSRSQDGVAPSDGSTPDTTPTRGADPGTGQRWGSGRRRPLPHRRDTHGGTRRGRARSPFRSRRP